MHASRPSLERTGPSLAQIIGLVKRGAGDPYLDLLRCRILERFSDLVWVYA